MKEGGIYLNYEQLIKRKKEIHKKIRNLQTKIAKLPEGKFICARNGKWFKWYISDGKNKIYLPKSERAIAEKMAYKMYLEHQLAILQKEEKAIKAYLKHYNSNSIQEEIQFFNSPQYKELLTPYNIFSEQAISEWINAPYERNSAHPEHLIHKTLSGILVRSKSEVLIDMVLCKKGTPFRYECGLKLGDKTLYLDFTILHPKTRKVFYWEHFGLIEDPNYSKLAISKLHTYVANGIFPSIQLITTYETKDHPLTVELMEKMYPTL